MSVGWSVGGQRLEYFGRGTGLLNFGAKGLTIDGRPDEACRVKHSRPDYDFRVGERRLVLKTLGEHHAELWSRGLLIPPTAQHVARQAAPPDAVCGLHASAPASLVCSRCGGFVCTDCEGVDGTHCAKCLPTLSAAELSRQVLEGAGPREALALFGGLAGKTLAAADQQLEKRVKSPTHQWWIRALVIGAALAGLLWMLASRTHSPPGY
jgi:hypothetical protein